MLTMGYDVGYSATMAQNDRLNVRIPSTLKTMLLEEAGGRSLATVVRHILLTHYFGSLANHAGKETR
jgi:hypothetical protein